MTRFSKFFAAAVIATIVMGFAGSVKAADTRSFTINITIKFLSVDIKTANDSAVFSEWNLGLKELGAPFTMAHAEAIRVNYGSNVSFNISSWVENQGNWTVAAAAAENTFKLAAGINTDNATGPAFNHTLALGSGNAVNLGSTVTVADNAATTGSSYVYYQLTPPTSISDVTKASGGSITVNIKVTPSA